MSLREAIKKVTGSETWQGEPLMIPSRDLSRWIPTHPLAQIEWTEQKGGRTGGHYVNVVKAGKWWRKRNADGKYPKGYPLEHLIGANCPDWVGSVAEGLTRTLEAIRDNYRGDFLAGTVPYLRDHGVDHDVLRRVTPEQFATFWRLVDDAARKARAAMSAEGTANSAILWRDLLGPEFPQPSKDELKESVAAALRSGSAGVVGGGIVSGGGRPDRPWPVVRCRARVGRRRAWAGRSVRASRWRSRSACAGSRGWRRAWATTTPSGACRPTTASRPSSGRCRSPCPVYDEGLRPADRARRAAAGARDRPGLDAGRCATRSAATRSACGTRRTRPTGSGTAGDGLLKLVDTARAHLFKELYFRETGEWLGEEVPPRRPEDRGPRGPRARLLDVGIAERILRLLGTVPQRRAPRARPSAPIPPVIARRLHPDNDDDPLFPKLRAYGKGTPGVTQEREWWWVIRDERGRVVGGAMVGDMGHDHPVSSTSPSTRRARARAGRPDFTPSSRREGSTWRRARVPRSRTAR